MKKSYISLCVHLTRRFTTVMELSYWFHIQLIDLFNITIIYSFVQSIDVFASLLSITSLVELVFALVFFLFFLSHTFPIVLSALIETFTLSFLIVSFNTCDNNSVRHMFCTGYIHAYIRFFKRAWSDTPPLPLAA